MVFLLTKHQRCGLLFGSGIVLASGVVVDVLIQQDIINTTNTKNLKEYLGYGFLGTSIISSMIFAGALAATVVKVPKLHTVD